MSSQLDFPWGTMPYRPTGIGGFGFSVNWEKVPGDEEVARRVITFLEDRRVLFGMRHMEDEQYCVDSANQIRHFLTDQLSQAKAGLRQHRVTGFAGPQAVD